MTRPLHTSALRLTGAVLLLCALLAGLVVRDTSSAAAAYQGTNGKIIFERYDNPWTVSGSGGAARRLRKIGADAYSFTYSPDGTKIAFEAWVPQIQIWVMNRDGSNPRSVTEGVDACIGAEDPTWSPNGRRIAFSCLRSQGFLENDIYSIRVGGGGLRRITEHGDALYPAWSPTGERIAFGTYGNTIHTVPSGGGADTMISAQAPGGVFAGAWQAPDWSPDGETLVIEASPDGIYTMDADTGAPSARLAELAMEPVFSPNGKRIAYVSFAGSNTDIWTMNIDGSDKRQITSGTANDRSPNWGVRP